MRGWKQSLTFPENKPSSPQKRKLAQNAKHPRRLCEADFERFVSLDK